jgi:hypothetical protein
MSYVGPQENTLGVLLTPRPKRGLLTTGRKISSSENPHRASLGTAFIGLGASLVVALRAIYGFSWFVSYWNVYPNQVAAVVSWIILVIAMVAAFVTARVIGDRLPDWMFAIFLSMLAFAVAFDLMAVWELHDIGRHATAALTAGMALLLVITLRGPIEILVSAGVLGAGLATVMVINTAPVAENFAPQITSLAFAVLPAIIGVVVVRGFRRMVQIELDRVLVQSIVSAPRFAVGMLASEELARLDLAAEELLDSVATGRTSLPLRPRTASIAASLATELRLHLIEGRRETWLYHAVTESEMLGKSVTLTDKGSLAGLLDDNQRDGLLAAIWLIVSENAKASASRTVQVQVGPIETLDDEQTTRKLTIPIAITTTGVARNRVDPSTWDAMRRVGRYSDSTQNASLRVDIECLVDNPADV